MRNTILPLIVNIWPELMLAGEVGSLGGVKASEGRFSFIFHDHRKGTKSHKAIYRGEGTRPKDPVSQE
jgi:hypothetical protein